MLSALAEADLAVAPVPPDPYELVNGGVRSLVMPADRTAAIYLLERAKQYSKLHMPDTPAYRMQVSFNASGSAADTGPGELTETRWPTQGWRWTARLGSFSIVRVGFRRQMFGDKHVTAIPMRIHMLRNAIFWAAQATPSNAQIRMAAVQANGSPATCILLSGMPPATQSQTRLWEEAEYCIDNASGALLVHSTAPGTFTVYGYTKNLQFHGRLMPDRITIYVAGATVVDAHLEIADAGPVDESLLKPTPEMLSNGEPVSLSGPTKFPLIASSPSPTNMIQPVIVLAEIDAEGNVPDLEVSSAANAALAPAALEFVKKRNFGASGSQRVAYINVKFVPLPQSN
jgi:hypothetical protein